MQIQIQDSSEAMWSPQERGQEISMEQIEEMIYFQYSHNPQRGGEIIMNIEENGYARYIQNGQRIIIRA